MNAKPPHPLVPFSIDSDLPTFVQVQDVSKYYPAGYHMFRRPTVFIKAVVNVSFSLYRGETFALVGESGSGKTTLGKLITRLEVPDSGQIFFDGIDITKVKGRSLKELRRKVQIVFQDPFSSLDPRMQIGELLLEPLTIHRLGDRVERMQRIYRMLDEVGIPRHYIDRYPHEFSGGQRQRIVFARALMLQPTLVVADEPVSALDVSVRSQILNLMRELQHRHDLTYFIISHDLSVVRSMADRVGVMYLGKIVELAAAKRLFSQPKHPYTLSLLAAAPVADPVRERTRARFNLQGEIPSVTQRPTGCPFHTRCWKAEQICANDDPELKDTGQGHMVACHFPLDSEELKRYLP